MNLFNCLGVRRVQYSKLLRENEMTSDKLHLHVESTCQSRFTPTLGHTTGPHTI